MGTEPRSLPPGRAPRYKGKQRMHIYWGVRASPAATHLPLNTGGRSGGAVVFLHYVQPCAYGGGRRASLSISPSSHCIPSEGPSLGRGGPVLWRAGARQRRPRGGVWWRRGEDGSVVLEEGEEVIVAAAGEVGGPQVGQQLVGVRQLGQELGGRQRVTSSPPSTPPYPPCGSWDPKPHAPPTPPLRYSRPGQVLTRRLSQGGRRGRRRAPGLGGPGGPVLAH